MQGDPVQGPGLSPNLPSPCYVHFAIATTALWAPNWEDWAGGLKEGTYSVLNFLNSLPPALFPPQDQYLQHLLLRPPSVQPTDSVLIKSLAQLFAVSQVVAIVACACFVSGTKMFVSNTKTVSFQHNKHICFYLEIGLEAHQNRK